MAQGAASNWNAVVMGSIHIKEFQTKKGLSFDSQRAMSYRLHINIVLSAYPNIRVKSMKLKKINKESTYLYVLNTISLTGKCFILIISLNLLLCSAWALLVIICIQRQVTFMFLASDVQRLLDSLSGFVLSTITLLPCFIKKNSFT